MRARFEVEAQEEWSKWSNEMPFIQFDPGWNVSIIPPFGGAVARFLVKYNNKQVSVYADVNCRLGYYFDHRPYWEIYPYKGETDTFRCFLEDVDSLIEAIREELNRVP